MSLGRPFDWCEFRGFVATAASYLVVVWAKSLGTLRTAAATAAGKSAGAAAYAAATIAGESPAQAREVAHDAAIKDGETPAEAKAASIKVAAQAAYDAAI